ncbi:PGF-CTERM sorting domain-containing protein [Methanolobus vulcani]|jgi:PGF-CTERM protein|uniref:PGF-CTERM sorting domain-containing protein n=1 Tax=Methanolobus vulcani TaxID=38026 RepID=A0A7Z8KQS7_9EURY|nr:PGF-CTERM sorting domain-containing protein [Methanolobus vulcani]TQD28226.1 PGF-CTERM sorting domain-containing protein [Methanolobus vulcani]
MNIKKVFIVALLATVLMVASAFPASASEDASEAIDEVIEHAEELVEMSTTIHDETMNIADDESLDDDLRAAGEAIHQSSHEIEQIGEAIKEDADELKVLAEDPETNEDDIIIALDEIMEHAEEALELIDSLDGDLQKVMDDSPESHQEYAESISDALTETGSIANHIIDHAEEVEEALGLAESVTLEGDAGTHVSAMEDLANEIVELSETIHDETEYIADDEALDQEWRDYGEEVHLSSHTVEQAAEAILECIDELKPLAADPDANEAAVKNKVSEIDEHAQGIIDELTSHDEAVHTILELEEPYLAHAEATHDAVHKIEYEALQIQKKGEKLEAALYPEEEAESVETATGDSEASSTSTESSTPGFEIAMAVAGIFGAVCLFRRE